MTIYETIMQMLMTAAENMVPIESITLGRDHYDTLLADLAYKHGWDLSRTEGTLQFHGPRGPVTIRRGE